MEPETIAASAFVSAVVSWFVTSHVTVRQERAKRREALRGQLREAVEPLQRKLARYRYAKQRTTAEREASGPMHMSDLEDLGRIYRITEQLPALRRYLIGRRLRAIYGNGVVDMVRNYPTSKAGDSVGTWFGTALGNTDEMEDPRTSLIHRTYSTPPAEGGGRTLAKHLRRLSRGW